MNRTCKSELTRVTDAALAEFYGFLISNGKLAFTNEGPSLLFSSREFFVIRKIVTLANIVNFERSEDILRKEKFKVTIEFSGIKVFPVFEKIKNKVLGEFAEYEKKAFLRGIYLGCGILSTPPSYHLEFRFERTDEMNLVKSLLNEFSVKNFEKNYIIYVAGRENVQQFLYVVGAKNTYLLMEEDAVSKKMINDANRRTNSEYANLKRQAEAALKQIRVLKKMEEQGLIQKLSEPLKEVALLRLEYPFLSLSELSAKTKGRLSKQMIYYRLKKIISELTNDEK